jgi:hypothetical protein
VGDKAPDGQADRPTDEQIFLKYRDEIFDLARELFVTPPGPGSEGCFSDALRFYSTYEERLAWAESKSGTAQKE